MQIQLQQFCPTRFKNKLAGSKFEPPTGENITQKRDELTGMYFYKDTETGKGLLRPEHMLAIMEAFGNNHQAAFDHQRKLQGSLRVFGDYRMFVNGTGNSEISIHNTRTGVHRNFTGIPNAKAFLRSLDGDLSSQFNLDLLSELLTNWLVNPADREVNNDD